MATLIPVTDEAQLTDSQGWLYRGDEHRPLSTIPQIMNLTYSAELGEELDWEECLKLAVYADNVMAYGEDLTNDRLAELWEECQENYQGSHASEGEFAEDYLREIGDIDERTISNLVIDWEATYQSSFSHDFWNTYIYARNEETGAVEIFRFFFRNA